MHKEILSANQIELLPLVKHFIREYYLVGGTAIALHLGHRRSIDFDLFKLSSLRPKNIVSEISSFNFPYTITRRVTEQMNVVIHDVKFTFYQYPFKIDAGVRFENILRLPELIDLAAMKAYALGRRSRWKDYVDLFFILKNHYSVEQISQRACAIYDQMFSEKLFRAQLSYFEDIDFSEPIDYLIPAGPEQEIKEFLIDQATDIDLF
ncbi:MAG: nucleotidyl transferase AbiEii/AbiGii toxin family protein [Bacteroidetes bacterium]|nr:nucleotidyl transferase AbiEii/AbiGii toxin family protein [Bacteroidota bacterium]